MTANRQPWYERPGASPVLKELVAVRRLGVAALGSNRLKIPLITRAAQLLASDVANQSDCVATVFDELFELNDAWIRGQRQREAASSLFGHHTDTYGMPELDRRTRVASDFYHQGMETFRREDRNGQEPILLRQVAEGIEALIKSRDERSREERLSVAPVDTYVERVEYLNQVRTLIDEGHKVICIRGEPGTGKTTFANQIPQSFGFQFVLRLRAGNRDVLNDDLVNALMAEGRHPASWSESYCRVEFRRLMSDEPRADMVIIDDVGNMDQVWGLIPPEPRLPVIVTTRVQPTSDTVAALELRDFSQPQALTFVRGNIDDCTDAQALTLLAALGTRPLALEHSVRYLHATPDVALEDLTNALRENVVTGLDLIALPTIQEKNLALLYRQIIGALESLPAVLKVLDMFLAITGRSGMTDKGLYQSFLQHEFNDATGHVAVGSAVRILWKLRTPPAGEECRGNALPNLPDTS